METLFQAPVDFVARNVRMDPPLSDAELERFCAVNDLWRIERTRDGVIRMNPPTGMLTGGGNAEIALQLGAWCKTHRRGRAFDSNTGYYLPDGSMMSPDASYLTNEALATLPKKERKGFPHICPNFVVELISESDTLTESKEKMTRWMENGAELGWLIQPEKERVFVYTGGSADPVVVQGDSIEGSGPVEGFRLDLSELWDWYES